MPDNEQVPELTLPLLFMGGIDLRQGQCQVHSPHAELCPLPQQFELADRLPSVIEEHPLQRLSADVYQEIFLACLPEDHYPTLTPSDAPVLLTHVCRAWNQLAKATPRLWNTVHLPIRPGDNQVDEGTMLQVQGWFEASRQLPMEVSLWLTRNCPAERSPINACVAAHSFHIRVLDLSIPAQIVAHFLTTWISPTGRHDNAPIADTEALWPVLEKVTLRMDRDRDSAYSRHGKQVSKALFWAAPRLKTIYLSSVYENLLTLPLKWNALEEITVVGRGERYFHDRPEGPMTPSFTYGEARTVLQKCPLLSKLVITISEDPFGFEASPATSAYHPDSPQSIAHDKLATLRLGDNVMGLVDPHSFLRGLQMPALRKLVYYFACPTLWDLSPGPSSSAYHHPLVRFLSSQVQPVLISSFEVSIREMTTRELLECLDLMPLLEKLRLTVKGESFKILVDCDANFLEYLLPLDMRASGKRQDTGPIRVRYGPRSWSPEKPVTIPYARPLDIPDTGLCPLLSYLSLEYPNFTFDHLLRFVGCRLTLSQTQPSRYARIQRFYGTFDEPRPDFVARDPRGATCTTEEALMDLDVEGRLILRTPPRAFGGKARLREQESVWKEGLRQLYLGDSEPRYYGE